METDRTMSSPSRRVLGSQENVPSQSTTSQTPGPPKPPRSAFMCFADARKDEVIRSGHDVSVDDDLLAIVASEWRDLDESARAIWDEVARDDKVRYVREKAEYKGPWAAPKRRAKKHPLAPKRPMSAFLKYSQNRRAMIKEQNPDMGNTDVSRLLGEMWRNASELERRPYVEQELLERAAYNETIKKFREQQARIDAESRTSHHVVKTIAESRNRAHPPAQYTYEPLTTFEPLSVDDATTKADEQALMNPHPVQYYETTADQSLQRAFFRPHERRGDQPLYHHHATSFRLDRNGYQLRDGETGPAQRMQIVSGPGGSPAHFGGSRPFTLHESSFFHYP